MTPKPLAPLACRAILRVAGGSEPLALRLPERRAMVVGSAMVSEPTGMETGFMAEVSTSNLASMP